MIDFLKYRYVCAFLTCVLCLSFIGGIVYKRSERGSAFIYSVDFTGGTQVLAHLSQPTSAQEVSGILERSGFEGTSLRELGSGDLIIRVKNFENTADGIGQTLKRTIETALPSVEVEIKQVDSVGAGVGASLRINSLYAVSVALLFMLLYIWYRFRSLSFGVGSVVSLFHDVLVILSFVLWFDYEVSLNIITAVLFILGYSINDTIVIFARIRENIARMRGSSVYDVINLSINETLRRTILTSFSTSLVVIALLLFGGEALRALSIPLILGMVFGTYSSIFIASPVMLALYRKE